MFTKHFAKKTKILLLNSDIIDNTPILGYYVNNKATRYQKLAKHILNTIAKRYGNIRR